MINVIVLQEKRVDRVCESKVELGIKNVYVGGIFDIIFFGIFCMVLGEQEVDILEVDI